MCVHMPVVRYTSPQHKKHTSYMGDTMRNRAARLDIRTTKDAKDTIGSAAELLGTTISAFMLEAAMEKALKVLQQAQTINLNNKESKRFIAALENPPEPSEALKQLFKKHKDKK